MKAKEVLDLIYMVAKAVEKIPEMYERFQNIKKDNEYYSRQQAYDAAVKQATEAYQAEDVGAQLSALEEIG